MDAYARAKRLSRTVVAVALGVPYSTFKKWFFTNEKRRAPSSEHIILIKRFLDAQSAARGRSEALWSEILEWWRTQHRYRTTRELADDIGWDDTLASFLEEKRVPPRLVVESIARAAGILRQDDQVADAAAVHRVQRLRSILLLLEDDLVWFRDGSPRAREALARELDSEDMGYISSLLTMLSDEERFQRWRSLTTNRFNFFKKRGGK